LRNAAAGRGAQDDDAKHDPSPGDPDRTKADTGSCTLPFRNVSRPEVHLRQNVKMSPAITCGRRTHTY
jgi:hypothetical protein